MVELQTKFVVVCGDSITEEFQNSDSNINTKTVFQDIPGMGF